MSRDGSAFVRLRNFDTMKNNKWNVEPDKTKNASLQNKDIYDILSIGTVKRLGESLGEDIISKKLATRATS